MWKLFIMHSMYESNHKRYWTFQQSDKNKHSNVGKINFILHPLPKFTENWIVLLLYKVKQKIKHETKHGKYIMPGLNMNKTRPTLLREKKKHKKQ